MSHRDNEIICAIQGKVLLNGWCQFERTLCVKICEIRKNFNNGNYYDKGEVCCRYYKHVWDHAISLG